LTVEIVDVSGCKKDLLVEIPHEEVDGEIEKRAQEYARKAKVPGFRPGRIPLSIVKQRFADELRNDATQELINQSWEKAVSDHDLHPLTKPVVELMEAKPGNPLKFKLSFEVLPEVEPHDYKGIAMTAQPAVVEEADVDRALEGQREQFAEFVPVEEGEVRKGHLVTLTVDGTFEGEGKPFHEDDVSCVVGDPQTNETFSENLSGARSGETRSFAVDYPMEYHRKRFAGKRVHYQVLVKDIKDKQLPDLNDDFAKDFGGAENLQEFRAKVRDDLMAKAVLSAENTAKEALIDQVVRSHTFDIPDSMIREELGDYVRNVAAGLARQGIDINKASIDWNKIFEQERPRAEQAVRRAIVLNAVAGRENLEVTEDELEHELQALAQATRKSSVALRAQLEKDKRIQGFKEHLLRKKALDFIFRNANITQR
jgi:trigger factor